MKLLLIAFSLIITACAQLTNSGGAISPVIMLDAKQKTYSNLCSGTVEDWSNCNDRANKTCVNGYEIIQKNESPVGAKRELIFKCK